MKYTIRPGEPKDIEPYLHACQKSAALAYAHFDREVNLFDQEHYFHPSMMAHWRSLTKNTKNHHWYVAELIPSGQVIGGIIWQDFERYSLSSGLYVEPRWQSLGIGRALRDKKDKLAKRPIFFEVYNQAHQAIAAHRKHGARPTGRQRPIRWDSWPTGVSLLALEFVIE